MKSPPMPFGNIRGAQSRDLEVFRRIELSRKRDKLPQVGVDISFAKSAHVVGLPETPIPFLAGSNA